MGWLCRSEASGWRGRQWGRVDGGERGRVRGRGMWMEGEGTEVEGWRQRTGGHFMFSVTYLITVKKRRKPPPKRSWSTAVV